MNLITEGVDKLVAAELAECLLKHGMFASHHEAYAILREELEETVVAVNDAMREFDCAWGCVKEDCLEVQDLTEIRVKLLAASAEIVQSIAMVDKWALLLEDPRTDG